ncbi:metal ABC transporter substrate-binding protein [Citricoccus sp. I39-566]|uniref:metal ABC transporter substrate-binding protein n=1 Tax=Citricoccus sp. I39-566 TaxID=3073268 RepID=UPI00286BFE1C|nr:metal ABC transporter substrate-binding protein [Citricoccus sp. I39-566]WMY76964.1 metal ABC transporter substrate-binding protein [Citricoccus sp. I39-566]
MKAPFSPAPVRLRGLAVVGLVSTATLVLAGCSAGGSGDAGGSTDAAAREPVAVATTTQLGSVLEDITACAGAGSATIMGPGDDPHDFSPSSRQVAEMTRAELVVSNGLDLEAGMQTALDNAEADGARLFEVAPMVEPLPFAEHDGHSGAGPDHAHGGEDPHFWMDASRMAQAAELIGAELAEITGDEQYAECAAQTSAELEDVHTEIRDLLASIPEDRRTLVTDHAAYNYFADAYGLEIAGVVVPGGSTDAEPSSEQLAVLTEQIQAEGADALVTSAGGANSLIEALSAETDGEVPVVELYEGGLGPEGSGAQAYADAMLLNASTLAEALQ